MEVHVHQCHCWLFLGARCKSLCSTHHQPQISGTKCFHCLCGWERNRGSVWCLVEGVEVIKNFQEIIENFEENFHDFFKLKFHTIKLASLHEILEIFHSSILVMNCGVIADIIAEISHRTLKNRWEPNSRHSDFLQIWNFFWNAFQVAYTVTESQCNLIFLKFNCTILLSFQRTHWNPWMSEDKFDKNFLAPTSPSSQNIKQLVQKQRSQQILTSFLNSWDTKLQLITKWKAIIRFIVRWGASHKLCSTSWANKQVFIYPESFEVHFCWNSCFLVIRIFRLRNVFNEGYIRKYYCEMCNNIFKIITVFQIQIFSLLRKFTGRWIIEQ